MSLRPRWCSSSARLVHVGGAADRRATGSGSCSHGPARTVAAGVVVRHRPRWCGPARVAERDILDQSRVRAAASERVDQVRSLGRATVDHNEAELRRIERDLHDGAQARIAAAGMNVGLAEKLVHYRPRLAAVGIAAGGARTPPSAALEDLRIVVRGIHPPVLADRGLGSVPSRRWRCPIPIAGHRRAVDCRRLARAGGVGRPTSRSPSAWRTWPSTRRPSRAWIVGDARRRYCCGSIGRRRRARRRRLRGGSGLRRRGPSAGRLRRHPDRDQPARAGDRGDDGGAVPARL